MGSETPLDLGSDEDRSRCACDATYGKCINCVRNENEYDEDPGDCWNCGGEGYIADCFDGFCEEAEYGCEDCTRPCPECARPKPNSDEMRRVLAEALEQANGPTPADANAARLAMEARSREVRRVQAAAARLVDEEAEAALAEFERYYFGPK